MSAAHAHVRSAIGALLEGADKVRSLADLLEDLGGIPGDAEPIDLRRAAIQSVAMQVIMTGAIAVGPSERLSTVAALHEGAD